MEKAPIVGLAWKFGDHIDTGQLAPTQYTRQGVEVYARHCLEFYRPEFAAQVAPGDIIVAGRNFGTGSSREQSVLSLRQLRVGAVVAEFFARIFYRNAINLGMPVVECNEVGRIEDGDRLEVYPMEGRIVNLTRRENYQGSVLPSHMMEIISAGGLVPYLERKLQ